MQKKHTLRRKLSVTQWIKGTIIRFGFARKVKVKGQDGRLENRFQLRWGRVSALLASLAFIGYLSLATAGFFFLKLARDFPEVKFHHVAIPWLWDDLALARGNYYIDQAISILETGGDGNFLHLLRAGLIQAPENTQGRLVLAHIYHRWGRPDLAISVLQSHVQQNADNMEYLRLLLDLLFANHDDHAVERITGELLGDDTEPTDRNLTLAIARATANFNRGNHDRAQQIIDDFNLTRSRTGMLLQARIDWETGARGSAIERLEKVSEGDGALQEQALQMLIYYLWEDGRHERALRVALARALADPLSYHPQLRLIFVYHKMEDQARLEQVLEDYFRHFGAEHGAMDGLASFAGQNQRPAIARRVYAHMQAHGMNTTNAAIRLMEAYVGVGNHHAAVEFFRSIEPAMTDWTPLQQGFARVLLTVAHFGVGNAETAEALLREVSERTDIDPNEMLKLADRLALLESYDRARSVLQRVRRDNPNNQDVLARLVRMDIDTHNNRELMNHLAQLMSSRRPPLPLLEAVRRYIGSDLFLFESNREEMLRLLNEHLSRGNRLAQGS